MSDVLLSFVCVCMIPFFMLGIRGDIGVDILALATSANLMRQGVYRGMTTAFTMFLELSQA